MYSYQFTVAGRQCGWTARQTVSMWLSEQWQLQAVHYRVITARG